VASSGSAERRGLVAGHAIGAGVDGSWTVELRGVVRPQGTKASRSSLVADPSPRMARQRGWSHPRVPGTVGSVGQAESRGPSRAVLAQGSAVVTRPLDDPMRGLDQEQPSLVITTMLVIFSGKAYHSSTV